MSTAELLTAVKAAGIRLRADGGRLTYDAPKGAMTAELRDQLTQHKAEVLQLLAPTELVPLMGGLVVPRPALDLVLDLEARGVALRTDADHQFVLPDDARLTETDRAALLRWRHHVAALIEYQAPVPAWVQ